jgi:DNA-binding GntR family transcriptional regulator
MHGITLSPISSQDTLADIVTDRIREAIIRGSLKPGVRLAEPALAAELGVSRSPVREALVRLVGHGLVRREANRGFSVWEPAPADVDEILSLRVMMETLAAELIIDQLTGLEEIVERQKQAVEANDFLRLTREDRRFHDYLVERAANSRLLVMWNKIMAQWEVLVFRRAEHCPAVSATVLTDHQDILKALKERHLNKVVTLHREINKRVGRQMKEAL